MRNTYRNGPQHWYESQPVTFVDIRKRFDFQAIRIGRWVTNAEHQRAAAEFYDALCDLKLILQVPDAVISLRGSLSLHYGTGGRPGVAAHYVPATRTFALAKNAGPGSIAHEWFHAFDHYIADKAFCEFTPDRFGSYNWLHDHDLIPHRLNDALAQFYRAVLLDSSGQGVSAMMQASIAEDKRRGQLYYSLPEEACARAFEAAVQDATLKNSFLVSGTQKSAEAELGLYPKGEQRELIAHAMRNYFALLGRALFAHPSS